MEGYSKSSVFFCLVWLLMYWTNVGRGAERGGLIEVIKQEELWVARLHPGNPFTHNVSPTFLLSRETTESRVSPFSHVSLNSRCSAVSQSVLLGRERMLPVIMDGMNGLYLRFLSRSFRSALQPLLSD